jgi:hypothetical protein
MGRIGHLAQALVLLGVAGVALGEVGEADDGIHRRADFMAHVGQEGALGAVGRFGLVLGAAQFPRAFIDQLFEVLAVAFQFRLDPLFLGNVFLDAEVVGHPPIRLAHRRNDRQFLEDRAVLALVDEFALPDFAAGQGLPQLVVIAAECLAGFQDARILADASAGV